MYSMILQVGYDRLLGVTFRQDDQERAIDVPDDFVVRKKTPPKYPSPKRTKVTSRVGIRAPDTGLP